jgi:hypothetical protein
MSLTQTTRPPPEDQQPPPSGGGCPTVWEPLGYAIWGFHNSRRCCGSEDHQLPSLATTAAEWDTDWCCGVPQWKWAAKIYFMCHARVACSWTGPFHCFLFVSRPRGAWKMRTLHSVKGKTRRLWCVSTCCDASVRSQLQNCFVWMGELQ